MPSMDNHLRIPCPFCGGPRIISRLVWEHDDIEIKCYSCKIAYPARHWHRAYERRGYGQASGNILGRGGRWYRHLRGHRYRRDAGAGTDGGD